MEPRRKETEVAVQSACNAVDAGANQHLPSQCLGATAVHGPPRLVKRSVAIWKGRSQRRGAGLDAGDSRGGRLPFEKVSLGDCCGVEVGRDRAADPGAVRFVQPHDDVAGAVLGQLHRLDHDPWPGQRHQRLHHSSFDSADRAQRQVDPVPLVHRLRDTGTHPQGDVHAVPALVGVRIGEQRRPQQRQPHRGRAGAAPGASWFG